jgi:hypothetical protein
MSEEKKCLKYMPMGRQTSTLGTLIMLGALVLVMIAAIIGFGYAYYIQVYSLR